ncbi:hypothetical protein ACQJBY_069408 [Aegilops geniculata]
MPPPPPPPPLLPLPLGRLSPPPPTPPPLFASSPNQHSQTTRCGRGGNRSDEEATDREAGKRNQAVLLPWPGLDQPHLPPPSPAERSGGSASSSEQGRTGIRSRDLLARGRHRTDSNLQPVPTQKVTVIQEEPDATEDANVQVSIANCHKHREPLEYLIPCVELFKKRPAKPTVWRSRLPVSELRVLAGYFTVTSPSVVL